MKIFLSYSSQDRARVVALAEELDLLGHSVWYDQELAGGDKWWQRILESIRDADTFILCLTPASLKSKPTTLEFSYAVSLKKNLVPLELTRLDPSQELHPELLEFQLVRYYSDDMEYRRGLARALNGLKPAPSLPDPLPAPPQLPLSTLPHISRRLREAELGAAEQQELFRALSELYALHETSAQAKVLLRAFREHLAVLNTIAIEIDSLLQLSSDAIRSGNCGALQASVLARKPTQVRALRFAPNSRDLAVAWGDGTLVIYNDEHDPKSLAVDPELAVSGLAFHPRLSILFAAGTANLVLRSLCTTRDPLGNPYEHKVGHLVAMDHASNEARLKVNDFVEWRLGEQAGAFAGPTGQIESGGGAFRAVAVSPDGELLVVGTDDRKCVVWDLRWQRLTPRLEASGLDSIRAVAFHPNGAWLVAGDYKGKLLVWRTDDYSLVLETQAHAGPVLGLDFSTDQRRLVTCSRDGYAHFWDIDGWQRVGSVGDGTSGMVGAVFSPVDSLVLIGSRDGSLGLWDAERFLPVQSMSGSGAKISALDWSDDGARIAAGTEAGDVLVHAL